MNESTYNKLLKKLDTLIPSSSRSSEQLCSVGVLSEHTNVEQLSKNEAILAHTMLHLFYSNNNGKNLNRKTIEKLHKEVIKKIPHKNFDGLDTK